MLAMTHSGTGYPSSSLSCLSRLVSSGGLGRRMPAPTEIWPKLRTLANVYICAALLSGPSMLAGQHQTPTLATARAKEVQPPVASEQSNPRSAAGALISPSLIDAFPDRGGPRAHPSGWLSEQREMMRPRGKYVLIGAAVGAAIGAIYFHLEVAPTFTNEGNQGYGPSTGWGYVIYAIPPALVGALIGYGAAPD